MEWLAGRQPRTEWLAGRQPRTEWLAGNANHGQNLRSGDDTQNTHFSGGLRN